MPDPMERWVGAAAFINGYLDQDAAEQDRQLEYLEGLAGVATRAENIRGAQADTRRAEALFPGQLKQQGLATTQMGLETQGMKRDLEMQKAMDELVQKEFGFPSYDVLKIASDAGGQELIRRMYQAQQAANFPERKVEVEGVKLGTELRTEKAVAAGTAPEAEARLREQTALLGEQKTEFEREVLQLRSQAKMPQLLVDTEKALRELEPLGKKIDMVAALATAKQRLGAAANTPLGKEQLMRDMFARKGLDYDAYAIRDFLIDSGEMESKQTLMENIFSADRARLDLLAAEGNMDMGEMIMLSMLQQNPELGKSLGAMLPSKPTDVKQLLEPLNKYINANKALLYEYHGVSYDRLSERQLVFTEQDLNEVIGGMLQDFPRFSEYGGLDANAIAEDIKPFLVNMINGMDPMHWDTAMQRHRSGLVQRWGQENYFAAQQLLDTVQWRMGQEENPDLVRPRAPYMGFPKKVITPSGAIQKTERQQQLESLAPNLNIEKLLGEGPLQLDSVEREAGQLLQPGVYMLQLDSVERELEQLLQQ